MRHRYWKRSDANPSTNPTCFIGHGANHAWRGRIDNNQGAFRRERLGESAGFGRACADLHRGEFREESFRVLTMAENQGNVHRETASQGGTESKVRGIDGTCGSRRFL